jgi:hypothetical protein
MWMLRRQCSHPNATNMNLTDDMRIGGVRHQRKFSFGRMSDAGRTRRS